MKKNKYGDNIFQTIVHTIVFGLYRIIIGPIICKVIFNVHATGLQLRKMKGPFIFVGNHVNNFDGFYHQFYASSFIRYVMNERIFRKRGLGPLLHFFHYIPKKKFSKDLKTVRLMFKAKKDKRIVGVFPEGRRNWDGRTQNHIGSIASLAKQLKLPVIAGITKGGFSAQPRWSGEKRRGKVEVEYKEILTPEDIKKHSSDKLLDIITKELDFKEYEYLDENPTYFRTKNPALGLERLLYICPQCKKLGNMTSEKYHIECTCDYKAGYDNYGKLESKHFDNLEEWNNWQRVMLKDIKYNDKINLVFKDEKVTLSSIPSSSHKPFKKIDYGRATLYKDKVVFEGKKTYTFNISEMWGHNIQRNDCYEFNVDKTTYLFTMNGRDNAYKWKEYMEL